MTSKEGSDGFVRAFLPGLVLGLIIGAFIGAYVVPLLTEPARPKREPAVTRPDRSAEPRDTFDPETNPDQTPDQTPADIPNDPQSRDTPPPLSDAG